MSYKVLARRTRPQTFADVVGQSATVNTLQRSLDQNRLHQAYLLTGTRGVGKTSIARILAKCMNCEQKLSSQPCGACSACKSISSGQFIDLIEIDAASHTKVEDIRTILDNIPYRPNKARYKIYLIDEVHMLSNHSFNALLKTLEEPPEYVKFILCTTDPQKLPATILSRCLRFHLHNLSPEEIKKHLEQLLTDENINFAADATLMLAEAADGSVRDSLSLLDQAIAYSNSDITSAAITTMLGMSDHNAIDKLISAISSQSAEQALNIVEQMAEQGENFKTATETLMREYHKLAIKFALSNKINQTKNESAHLSYEIAARGLGDLHLAPTERIGFEMMIMRLLAFQPQRTKSSCLQETNKMSADDSRTATTPQKSDSKFNWDMSFLQQIELSGISLELAKHCCLSKKNDQEIHLELNPKYRSMLNAKQTKRIQDAINTKLNSKLTLFIDISKDTTPPADTPHINTLDKKKSESSKLAATMQQDENSQRIIQAFNAEVIAGSLHSQEALYSTTTTSGEENNE